jgi:hypothetical protein
MVSRDGHQSADWSTRHTDPMSLSHCRIGYQPSLFQGPGLRGSVPVNRNHVSQRMREERIGRQPRSQFSASESV